MTRETDYCEKHSLYLLHGPCIYCEWDQAVDAELAALRAENEQLTVALQAIDRDCGRRKARIAELETALRHLEAELRDMRSTSDLRLLAMADAAAAALNPA